MAYILKAITEIVHSLFAVKTNAVAKCFYVPGGILKVRIILWLVAKIDCPKFFVQYTIDWNSSVYAKLYAKLYKKNLNKFK